MKIVVSGTSAGIGRALAQRLIARGHLVWGLARSVHELPGGAPTRVADVGHWESMQEAATAIGQSWGTIDAIVTCAAIQGEVGPALAADPAGWAATIQANLIGTFHVLRALRPLLLHGPDRKAKIVCFSGGGATKARTHFSAYGASKTAVVRLVETVALEEQGLLEINAIAPGAINTRLTDEVIAIGPERAGADEYAAALAQKRTGGGSLERALDLVEWLLSPASNGISGRLFSAPWDPWDQLGALRERLLNSRDDLYTLRRVSGST